MKNYRIQWAKRNRKGQTVNTYEQYLNNLCDVLFVKKYGDKWGSEIRSVEKFDAEKERWISV